MSLLPQTKNELQRLLSSFSSPLESSNEVRKAATKCLNVYCPSSRVPRRMLSSMFQVVTPEFYSSKVEKAVDFAFTYTPLRLFSTS